MRIVPFEPTHCDGAIAHPSQAHYQNMLDNPSQFRELWSQTCSALDDGLIAIGGAAGVGGMIGGWVLFTDRITPARFLSIHRTVVRGLSDIHEPVIAHVDPRNPEAMRWAKMLDMRAKNMDTLLDGRTMTRVCNV